MTKLILAGAAVLALASSPVMAQDADTDATMATTATTAPAPDSGAMAMRFVSREVVESTGQSDVPATGDLPICKADQQDNCINGWDKNHTGNRPLNYWPGKPASEIDGPIPATKPGG